MIYANTLKNDFVFDDESVVQSNTSITSLSNIPKFFTAEEGFHKVIGRYFRPVVSTTYTIDYALWGLNPVGFHLTNILINLVCCLLLFALLKNLFGKYNYGIEAAFIGALLFASHTIHTEAVSWISGRTDSLATLFFFASFLFYIREKKTEDSAKVKFDKYIILSLLFYIFGLLSKEMVVTVPVIIFLYDFVFKGRSLKDILKNRILIYVWFISVTLIYLLVRYLVLKDVPERETYMYFYGKDFLTAFLTMVKTIPLYFKLMIFPISLLYHYNGVLPYSNSILDMDVILSLVFILFLLASAYYLFKKHSTVSFAILFFLTSLIPVMNIIPSMNFMAERFLYISSFSLAVIASYLLIKFPQKKKILTILFAVLICVYSVLTFLRNKDWKDNDTLYSTAEGVNGSVLLVNCGNIFANKKQFDEAAVRFKKALEINRNNVLGNHNLGLVFLIKGEIDSAKYYIKRGIEVDSLAPDGYFQLANIFQKEGNISEAIKFLEKLQTIVPNYRDTKTLLDNLKSMNNSGIEMPNISGNRIAELDQRSYKYYQEKKYELALKDLEELVKINPTGKGGYLNNIALCYAALNKNSEAEKTYLEAIKADGKNTTFLSGLADLYLKMGKKEKAIEYYGRIISLDPENSYSRNKLDSLKKK